MTTHPQERKSLVHDLLRVRPGHLVLCFQEGSKAIEQLVVDEGSSGPDL
ncbi:hypothetical protein [Streptomyces sp. SAS_270]